MDDVVASGAKTLAKRRAGRRKDDQVGAEPHRERRRAAPQTEAAAQSVIMAHFMSTVPGAKQATPQMAAAAYAAAKPRRTPEDIRQEEFLREAEVKHQAAQKAWVFERRKGKKPRAAHVEDAVFIDIGTRAGLT